MSKHDQTKLATVLDPPLLYGPFDRPPPLTTLVAALQHLAAIFGGIVSAPLIIAGGMGLSMADTNYLILSALLVSGAATLLQIQRIGIVGSGLLAIQGTSFTFIGALLYLYHRFPDSLSSSERLGTLFGSIAVTALIMLPLSYFVRHLRHIFTPIVTGTTVLLLGSSLVVSTLGNLHGHILAQASTSAALTQAGLAVLAFTLALGLALSHQHWLRMTSIIVALLCSFAVAAVLGLVDTSALSGLPAWFVPEPMRFGFNVDWRCVMILLPIFFVTATEAIGDLSAASALARLPVTGPEYWLRIRGGLLADAINTLVAALLATFPNTTFSQNNGVIRLTGIASRQVGMVVALLLILLGLFPVVGGLLQLMPMSIIYGATLLMFGMVGLAGLRMLQQANSGRRGTFIAIVALSLGWGLSLPYPSFQQLPEQLRMLLQFPVSTGAAIAILLELCLPARPQENVQTG